MARTITVKGVGTAAVKPDYVVINLSIETKNTDYNTALQKAANQVGQLQTAITGIGYRKSDLKTMNFDVRSEYENREDRNGKYRRVFVGYICSYSLSLSFDFDNKRLFETLTTISNCEANPELEIAFTVKNPAEVSEALLRNATENAKKKAEILCSSSGVTLGELLAIDYNWGEINVISRTKYDVDERINKACICMPDIEPDDIDASDTVTFVWAIS